MKEEDLRQHFLVQLNGQYDGQASGETFNYDGKTDILIRHNEKNLFIAECKFWTCPEGFKSIIDQLLGYLTWRDSKTAILVFNKNKDMSRVIKQIPDLCRSHSNFIKEIEYKHDTGYRFEMHQKYDKDKNIIVTVLVFDLSTP